MTQSSTKMVITPSDMALFVGTGLVVGVAAWVWLTGQIAGLLFGFHWINVNLTDTFTAAFALPTHLDDPSSAWPQRVQPHLPGRAGFTVAAVLALAITVAGLVGAHKAYRRFGGGGKRGMASSDQLSRKLSPAAALKKAKRLRPSLAVRATIDHVAVSLGKAIGVGMRLAADIENSVLVFAAPRQGKSSQVVIPWLAHWQGPALATSVRPDIVLNTYKHRKKLGEVAVLDISDTAWPDQLRWSPVIGCEDYDKARRRAKVMVTVGKSGTDSTNSGFFHANAVNLLAAWFHAAALDGKDLGDIAAWALDETDRQAAVILEQHPGTARGVAGNVDGLYNLAPETRSSLYATVQTALTPILSPKARAVFCPDRSQHFDIETFLRKSGTAYLLVPEAKASEMAPLITAFVDEVTEIATDLANQAPTGRLDPPLFMALDEVKNVTPYERLPDLMSYAAGSGIFIAAILQNSAQARAGWGRDGADMLWDAATVKIALGGLSGDEAEDFADLAGKWREHVPGVQYGPGGTSHAPTDRERDVITASQIRQLDADKGEALVIAGGVAPVKTRMVRHYKSKDAAAYAASVDETMRRLGRGVAVADPGNGEDTGRRW